MEIVINIPDEQYEFIKRSDKNAFATVSSKECMLYAIKNGIPLPKGHGDLIDRDTIQISAKKFHCLGDLQTAQWEVYIAETVIPADK